MRFCLGILFGLSSSLNSEKIKDLQMKKTLDLKQYPLVLIVLCNTSHINHNKASLQLNTSIMAYFNRNTQKHCILYCKFLLKYSQLPQKLHKSLLHFSKFWQTKPNPRWMKKITIWRFGYIDIWVLYISSTWLWRYSAWQSWFTDENRQQWLAHYSTWPGVQRNRRPNH